MRLIDADELIEHAWRDKLDSRELIVEMIERAPTIKEIPTNIPIDVFEKLTSQEPKTDTLAKHGLIVKSEENNSEDLSPEEIAKLFAIEDKPEPCKAESKPQERSCQFCDNYKDGYCDVLDMKPCYPENGCDYFE